MKILIAPLNWGLGHASRCIPLIRKYLQEKCEVVIAGDGESLLLLRKTFPTLRYFTLAPLNLTYSHSNSQTLAIVRMLPQLIRHTINDRKQLRLLLQQEQFDLIISDNRFGLWHTTKADTAKHIYITHQLHIRLPRPFRWLEPIATALHQLIYQRYDEVWVPDYEDKKQRLAGYLSDNTGLGEVKYIGPLSRMQPSAVANSDYDIVAVLSGPEPQRTLLEKNIVERYDNQKEKVLIIRGRMQGPFIKTQHNNLTLVPFLYDEQLVPLLQGAKQIIARSGYSTIMDLHVLNLLHKATLIPTPGQSEQEYLHCHLEMLRK